MNTPQTPPKYTLQQLQEFLQLSKHFQGEVKEIKISKEALDWYKEQVKRVAKNFKELQFMGVKLK